MKSISVSQKIKILGALLFLSIFSVILVTIYLNQKNIKDATIVNIAGKQRMLTQKISKNIYFLFQTKINSFSEMDNAIEEFNYNLKTLKDGNSLLNISKAPSDEINSQLAKVEVLWHGFEKNAKEFKFAILNNDIQKLNSILSYVTEMNPSLLENVDKVVTLYTNYIEEKTRYIKYFQYASFSFLIIFAFYAFIQLKQIESHAREFIEKYTSLKDTDINELEPIMMESEKEFSVVNDSMNHFLNRVSSAMEYSNKALEQSKLASDKLLDLTNEFDDIISEIENKSEVMKQIDISEDIAIESSENLLKTTKKLNDLKNQLDILLKNLKK